VNFYEHFEGYSLFYAKRGEKQEMIFHETLHSDRKSVSDFQQRLFPHPVDEDVRFGVHEDRAADLIAPVIVMGKPPKRRFHPAGDHRDSRVRLPRTLAVGKRRPVRPQEVSTVRSAMECRETGRSVYPGHQIRGSSAAACRKRRYASHRPIRHT